MPRLKWPANLTPRTFYADDQLEMRRDELRRHVARQVVPITAVRFFDGDVVQGRDVAQGFHTPAFDDSSWRTIQSGERVFREANQLVWLRTRVDVPAELAGKTLALRFGQALALGGPNMLAESLLYLDGQPYHGVDAHHRLIALPEALCQPGEFTIAVQAWSGWRQWETLRWDGVDLIWFDAETHALAYDFDALYRTIQLLDKDSLARVEMVALGERALHAIDWTYPGSERFYESVRAARAITAEGIAQLKGREAIKPVVTHIGHTHLDVAWLWTLDNIKLKTARSWASALRLMEEFPNFQWIQSQPQLYKYIRDTQPELWSQVKQRVAEGRWEADGGMWVEADCNVTGGESLVRQFLHGIRFFREELGVQNVVLWLPDVFGYAWALPQIIKKCGLQYFMTTKISWNQFNRFPYDTFRWRGIDGTDVLAHFVTTPGPNQDRESNWFYTYNGQILPDTVLGNWQFYQQKELNADTLSTFGFGDGGGGPTREMMEFAGRLEDLPGLPKVRIGRVDDYFRRLEAQVWNDPRLPVWNGELYFEYHRGTYTSQAQNKRKNRQSEFLLHNAELYAAAASALAGATYPKAALDEAWEIVLRNQFHDIIPGSSIHPVYEDSAVDYARVSSLGSDALGDALGRLSAAIDLPEESLVVFNPTGVERSDLVVADLPDGMLPVDDAGAPLPTQGNHVYATHIPANGWRAFPLRHSGGAGGRAPAGVRGESPSSIHSPSPAHGRGGQGVRAPSLTVSERLIETPFARIELNESGQITRWYDTTNQREVLPPNQRANVLQAFEDKPLRFDAWDIDIYYQQKGREIANLVAAAVEENGPERGVLRLVWRFEDSTITQRMTVYARNPRVDFVTHVDWQQSQVLLKAAFPVEIHSTRATYEIQFGNVERPTHWNTSWDWARFETCGHKWADLSEGGYGVSLLNDCKYGYDVKDNVLRLTLIKSPIQPDPQADRGEHVFIYSLYPHEGDWFAGGTVAQGYRLNNPLIAQREPAHAGTLPASFSLVSCGAPNVMVETVKQAESGDGLVVRVYELGNRRGPVSLVFGRPIAGAEEVNLIEDEPRPVPSAGAQLDFTILPYEIKTFRVRLA